MPFAEVKIEDLARDLNIDIKTVKEKQKIIYKIRDLRKKQGWSQAELGKKMKLSQGRIAQIESGIGTRRVTFDVLFNILNVLGYEFQIKTKKAA